MIDVEIVPSILAADFANLGEALRQAEAGGAKAVQIDVMDGHFVPNLTIGPPVVKALRRATDLILDVHLMIDAPGDWVRQYADAGADHLTFHVEATPHAHRVVQQIHEAGMVPGIALNPATPLCMVEELLDDVGLVLVMTVNPGFGGQAFIERMVPKVARLRQRLAARGRDEVIIEVDGGINRESAPRIVAAGARWLDAGSAVYGGDDVAARIRALREVAVQGL